MFETLGAVEKLNATDYNWFKNGMKHFADLQDALAWLHGQSKAEQLVRPHRTASVR